MEDLYIEGFEIKDVKTLRGEHLARCIGRLAGKSGKTKFSIENSTRTRIVLADTRIHILGSFQNIRVARDAICRQVSVLDLACLEFTEISLFHALRIVLRAQT